MTPRDRYPWPPGDPQAIIDGCICPVIDNRYGRGIYTGEDGLPVFIYNQGCKLHGAAKEASE